MTTEFEVLLVHYFKISFYYFKGLFKDITFTHDDMKIRDIKEI